MGWSLLLGLLLVSLGRSRLLKNIEHTPFHKRNSEKILLDVRDTYVRFSSTSFKYDSDISVSANTSHITNGEAVRISWKNPTAGLFDIIAIYTPPSRDVQDYLDYRYVADTVGWQKGAGYFTEHLFNMRADYEIRYLTIDSQQKATVKATFSISVPDNLPMHGHIAVTGREGEMRVMWSSAKPDSPRVMFSQSSDLSDSIKVSAITTTYTAADLCGSRANITSPLMFQDPGFFHTALLKGLKPSTKYYYNYGTDSSYSHTTSFTTAPSHDAKVAMTRFIGYGDMGVYYPPYDGYCIGAAAVTRTIQKHVDKEEVDFLLHFGDISYARGRGYIWDQFMTQMTGIAEQVPYMVGVGNHEYDHVSGGEKDPSGAPANGFHPSWGNMGEDGGGECGLPTVHRYVSPDNGNGVFWYSFDYGLIHVVQFSSEHDFTPGSRQWIWLENDLKKVDRSRTPWVVVTSHRAMYTSQDFTGDHVVGLHMRLALEEMFYTYRVNLHLSGHYHSYERACSVLSGDCVAPGRATTYIVNGCGGMSLDGEAFTPYPWSKYQNGEVFGFQLVTANTTHMNMQFFKAPDDIVLDEITIPVWEESNKNKKQYFKSLKFN